MTQLPLEHDFEGVEDASRYKATPPARVLDTQIADSAKYYGIKPLQSSLQSGDTVLQLPTIMEQLVPTSVVETAIADDWAQGKAMWIPTASKQDVYTGYRYMHSGSLYLPCGVLAGSVQLDDFVDDGRGTLTRGDTQLSIDYAHGVISGFAGIGINRVQAVPAVQVRHYAYSAAIEVNDTNVGTEWTALLRPAPARGSVSVSYRAKQEWYELNDNGDYVLRDANNVACGNITSSGSTIMSLPSMPDSNSQIILSWTPHEFYKTLDDQQAGETLSPKTLNNTLVLPQTPLANLKPNSIRLSWNGGAAQDDGQGNITGSITGTVDYASGQIYPVGLNSAEIKLTAQQYSAERSESSLRVAISHAGLSMVAPAPMQAGSVKLALYLERTTTSQSTTTTTTTTTPSQPRRDGLLLPAGSPSTNRLLTGAIPRLPAGSTSTVVSNLTIHRDAETFAMVLTDNGNGGWLHNGKPIDGTIHYDTGEITLTQAALARQIAQPQYGKTDIAPHTQIQVYTGSTYVGSTISNATATVSAIAAADTRAISQTVDTGLLTFDLLHNKALPSVALFNTWVLEINGTRTIERAGTLYQNWDVLSGKGTAVGSINAAGKLQLNNIAAHSNPTVKVLQGVYVNGTYEVQTFVGRTQRAPIKPQSFTAYVDLGERTLRGDLQADESITGGLSGKMNTATGFFSINSSEPIVPDSLRYNAVSQSTMPLDSSIIGINATRLPHDGKVPVFRVGDMVVISNRLSHDLGSAHQAGTTVQLPRQDLDRLCVVDAKGKHVQAAWYDYDLSAGTLTWATPLNIADYTMPLTAVCIWEESNRIMKSDNAGKLQLQFGISRAYPQENTYVSSAILGGDLDVRATEPFSQQAWTNVWQDTRIGNELLAKLNVKDYPITLNSNGAITERWLIKFKSPTQFELYGEHLGLVAQSDVLVDLAPINPATNQPYFTLPALAFGAQGGGFAAQNCVRFNTTSTQMPVWVLRAVQPSPHARQEKDGFVLSLRGNTERV